VPKPAIEGGERPAQGFPAEALLDVRVCVNIERIIEVNKVVARRGQEYPNNKSEEKNANDAYISGR
jgi:hypothetical protein